MGHRSSSLVVLIALLSGALAAQAPAPAEKTRADAATQRATERIRALQRESDALASQERSLLVELRKLEVERELKAAELARDQHELANTQAQIKATIARAAELRAAADAERPDVEARLVQIYKMGRAGYWRMLVAVDDLRSMGRAYRTAAALTRIDRDRVQQYARTIDALAAERTTLETRAGELTRLEQQTRAARTAIDRAVVARNALIDSIDARRDLERPAHRRAGSCRAQAPGDGGPARPGGRRGTDASPAAVPRGPRLAGGGYCREPIRAGLGPVHGHFPERH